MSPMAIEASRSTAETKLVATWVEPTPVVCSRRAHSAGVSVRAPLTIGSYSFWKRASGRTSSVSDSRLMRTAPGPAATRRPWARVSDSAGVRRWAVRPGCRRRTRMRAGVRSLAGRSGAAAVVEVEPGGLVAEAEDVVGNGLMRIGLQVVRLLDGGG